MDSTKLDLPQAETIFRGFRLATMADPGIALAATPSGDWDFAQPDSNYGQIDDCCIGVSNGKILWIAPTDHEKVSACFASATIVEGNGRLLTPGLIDCHTHLVFGGNRANEWEARLTGVSYEEIARNGGGILSSVRATRSESFDGLIASASQRLKRLLAEGVTTVEIKSGYGLDLETEIKMLKVGRQLAKLHDVSVETTLLAAHATPPEFKDNANGYIDLACQEIIPAARDLCSAVDAFCESIAFDVEQVQRVFEAAIANGLAIKVHGEQLTRTGISAIASSMGAISADHLEYLSREDCHVMSNNKTVATVLPGAFYCLRETQKPPIEHLRELDVPIAVATDCNPGSSPVTSLLLTANMACNFFALTPEEAMAAITKNAAKALGLSDQVGILQPGNFADFAVWDVDAPAEIIYGIGHNPCCAVYRRGVERTGS